MRLPIACYIAAPPESVAIDWKIGGNPLVHFFTFVSRALPSEVKSTFGTSVILATSSYVRLHALAFVRAVGIIIVKW